MQAWSVIGYTYNGEAWCAACSPNADFWADYRPLFASDDCGDIACHECGQGISA